MEAKEAREWEANSNPSGYTQQHQLSKRIRAFRHCLMLKFYSGLPRRPPPPDVFKKRGRAECVDGWSEQVRQNKLVSEIYCSRGLRRLSEHYRIMTLIISILALLLLDVGDHQRGQVGAHDTIGVPTDEQRLLQRLLSAYDPASRPTIRASRTVEVRFQIALVQISQLDEVNQVLTTNVWLEQEWQDERLHWDPKDYNGLEVLRIPCQKLWLPDIVLYNSADDFTTGYMQSKAMVDSNGTVFWPPPAKLRSTCKIDITYFPFDDQVCTMKFGSWTYDGFQVNITKKRDKVDFQNYVQSGEWHLIRIDVERQETIYPISPVPYPDIKFHIVIRRRTLYYLFNIIFPCLWLTVLSLLGFWLPPDSGEKITLGITVLLAFSVFMLLIAENMPATSEFVPLIGIYLTVTMSTTSLSIVLTVFVLHLHHVGPNDKPVPSKLRHFFFNMLAPLLCMSSVRRYQHRANRRRQYFEDSQRDQQTAPEQIAMLGLKSAGTRAGRRCNGQQQQQQQLQYREFGQFRHIGLTVREVDVEEDLEEQQQPQQETVEINQHPESASDTGETIANRRVCNTDSPNCAGGSATTTADSGPGINQQSPHLKLRFQQYNHVYRHLRYLIKKQSEEEAAQLVISDWRMLAFVVDRMLFWLFLVAAFTSTTIILVIMPLFKQVA